MSEAMSEVVDAGRNEAEAEAKAERDQCSVAAPDADPCEAAETTVAADVTDEEPSGGFPDQMPNGGLPDEKQTGGLPDEKQTGGLPDEKQTGGLPDEKPSGGGGADTAESSADTGLASLVPCLTDNSYQIKEEGLNGFDRGLEPDFIVGATQENGKLMFLVAWKNEKQDKADLLESTEVYKKYPQLAIKFFEERLSYHTPKPEESGNGKRPWP